MFVIRLLVSTVYVSF